MLLSNKTLWLITLWLLHINIWSGLGTPIFSLDDYSEWSHDNNNNVDEFISTVVEATGAAIDETSKEPGTQRGTTPEHKLDQHTEIWHELFTESFQEQEELEKSEKVNVTIITDDNSTSDKEKPTNELEMHSELNASELRNGTNSVEEEASLTNSLVEDGSPTIVSDELQYSELNASELRNETNSVEEEASLTDSLVEDGSPTIVSDELQVEIQHEDQVTKSSANGTIPEDFQVETSKIEENGTESLNLGYIDGANSTRGVDFACTDDVTSQTEVVDEESDTKKHENSAKAIVDLLKRLTDKLEMPPAVLNKYNYITALKSSDGSIYVPLHHSQSTREHLTTLLGFAEEILITKNALAQVTDEETQVIDQETTAADVAITTNGALEETFTVEYKAPSGEMTDSSEVSTENVTASHITVGSMIDVTENQKEEWTIYSLSSNVTESMEDVIQEMNASNVTVDMNDSTERIVEAKELNLQTESHTSAPDGPDVSTTISLNGDIEEINTQSVDDALNEVHTEVMDMYQDHRR